jgi:murein DD-endopeptidase MepM/ murein hydrolase activator NlpD
MRFSWPIKNISPRPIQYNGSEIYVSQWFGENPQIYKQFDMDGHNGIDIAAPKGTPILSAHSGWIAEVIDRDTGYGISVQVYTEEDGGYVTIYGHMDKTAFPGMSYNLKNRTRPVKEGDTLGWVDSTGFSTGHHLHFGYRKLKDYKILNYSNGYFGWLDPKPLMKDPNLLEGKPMKIYKDNRTNPPTIIVGNTVDKPDNLKWIATQNGRDIPLLSGSEDIDWTKIVFDGEII